MIYCLNLDCSGHQQHLHILISGLETLHWISEANMFQLEELWLIFLSQSTLLCRRQVSRNRGKRGTKNWEIGETAFRAERHGDWLVNSHLRVLPSLFLPPLLSLLFMHQSLKKIKNRKRALWLHCCSDHRACWVDLGQHLAPAVFTLLGHTAHGVLKSNYTDMAACQDEQESTWLSLAMTLLFSS